MQSAIKEQVLFLTMLLSRHLSMSEILRVPALKDKLKDEEHPEHATVMLANYPLLMAADILLQGSKTVPVGDDQISHLEVTRLLARRFNSRYGDVLAEPQPLKMKSLRVMALTGDGKMSKSKPNGAVLLNEAPEEAMKKVKRAETAVEGETNNVLESHFSVAYLLANEEDTKKLDELKSSHLSGNKVMGDFKDLLATLIGNFLADYQAKKSAINMDDIRTYIEKGNGKAKSNAQEVIDAVLEATKFNS
jgi:tryptophanyl-tRNA synthetase